ncbi:MAG: CNNM domain-containing protein [Phycisphaerales bacterium]
MYSMLIVYLIVGIGFSFLCSLLEAVLLSVPRSHVMLMVERGSKAGARLARMKEDVDRPLAAILTLNTFAHTIGAAGVGAEAAKIWGSAWVGLVSFVVTLLILIFSEIIPKTIGAVHAKALSAFAAVSIHVLIVVLGPFVWACNMLSKLLTGGKAGGALSRDEVRSVATIALEEGSLSADEAGLIHNLIGLSSKRVHEVMTPRTVVTTLPAGATVGEVMEGGLPRFARMPLVDKSLDDARTYVHRHDLLHAIGEGRTDATLSEIARPMPAVPETTSVQRVLTDFVRDKIHLAVVVDEHGGHEGIVTLEDLVEELLGREIVDETDAAIDMRAVAKRLAGS